MAKTTWRFNFIEENASFSINTADSDIIGYTVVRAPKGNKEPYFFPAGNTEALKQMIGYPTCHYADIAEAISFNEEFGLYVSAPAGGSDDYPSYFGGEYITKYGLYPFYHVTDKDNPNYEVAVKPGKEKNLFRTVNGASQISVSSLTDPDASVLYGMKAEVTHALLRETRSMRWTIVLHLPDGDVYTLYSAENPLFQGKQKQRQTFELDLNEPFRNILQWKQRIPTGTCKVSLYLNGMHACDSTLEISE